MADETAFSPDYTASRSRFRAAALAAGWDWTAHGLGCNGPDGDPLTVDVARIGPERPTHIVVVSSGLHGIEGFFGAAVQVGLLEGALATWRPPEGVAVLMLHALNPYGFAHLRRVNENNVDLNRNFLLDGEPYAGAPARYRALDPLLNPTSPPGGLELFLLRAGWAIARHGMPALKDAVAGGQYDFPLGVFYGGDVPQATVALLRDHLPGWLGPAARRVLHVDFHTGLGAPATYKLLVDHPAGSPGHTALARAFGDAVQPWQNTGVSYAIRGGMGTWCKARFPRIDYDVLAAEFGTVSILRVIQGLRAENRAHHHCRPDDPARQAAKLALREVFAPSDASWRRTAVGRGAAIVRTALEVAATRA